MLHRPSGPVVVDCVSSRNVTDTVSFGVAIPQTWTGRFRCTTMWSAKMDGNFTSARTTDGEQATKASAAMHSVLNPADENENSTINPSCLLCLIHGVRVRHHGDGDLGWIFRRMMYLIVRDNALRFVVIVAAGIQVAIKARKIAARHFNPQRMAGGEVVAGLHRLKFYFVDLAWFHPGQRLVVSIAITHALDV